MEKQFKRKIVSLYIDGGGEYKSLDQYLNANGIEYLVSPPHTPQRVTMAERHHRHMIETVKKTFT